MQAIPDGVGNYNLAMIVYDRDRNPILTDANPFDGNSASVVLVASNTGPYYFEVYQYSEQCSGGTYRLVVSSVQPTSTPTHPLPTATGVPAPPGSAARSIIEPTSTSIRRLPLLA